MTALAFTAFQRLNLKCDEPLSNVAFKFNLRPYMKVLEDALAQAGREKDALSAQLASKDSELASRDSELANNANAAKDMEARRLKAEERQSQLAERAQLDMKSLEAGSYTAPLLCP